MEALENTEIDYVFSLFQKPLPGTLDPFTANHYMQEQMMRIIPALSEERPEILEKLKTAQSKSSAHIYHERHAHGFPNR